MVEGISPITEQKKTTKQKIPSTTVPFVRFLRL